MSLSIRLKRIGRAKSPIYRIVVADSRVQRDGKVVDQIGNYNPFDKESVDLKKDRIIYWLSVGANPTQTVARILSRNGLIEAKKVLSSNQKVSKKERNKDSSDS